MEWPATLVTAGIHRILSRLHTLCRRRRKCCAGRRGGEGREERPPGERERKEGGTSNTRSLARPTPASFPLTPLSKGVSCVRAARSISQCPCGGSSLKGLLDKTTSRILVFQPINVREKSMGWQVHSSIQSRREWSYSLKAKVPLSDSTRSLPSPRGG